MSNRILVDTNGKFRQYINRKFHLPSKKIQIHLTRRERGGYMESKRERMLGSERTIVLGRS